MYGVYIYISYIVYPEGDRDRGGGGSSYNAFASAAIAPSGNPTTQHVCTPRPREVLGHSLHPAAAIHTTRLYLSQGKISKMILFLPP